MNEKEVMAVSKIATELREIVIEMKIKPENPQWEDRDRLVLSKGHSCPTVYAALALKGFFDKEELMTFDQLGSILQYHPDMRKTPGIDISQDHLGRACLWGSEWRLGPG